MVFYPFCISNPAEEGLEDFPEQRLQLLGAVGGESGVREKMASTGRPKVSFVDENKPMDFGLYI